MKNRILTMLAVFAAALSIKAQIAITDSIRPERIVVKSSQFGISSLNNLDTYLAGYNFKGAGLYYSHENFRDARTGKYRWKYQTLFSSTLGYAELGNNTQLAGLAAYQWSGYHPFTVNSRLKLLAGAQIQIEGGALYIPNNGNNPVSVKLRTALTATGMAIYHFPVKGKDWVARYQLDIPLVGAMFAPEFGQSYYEIFNEEQTDGTVALSNPFNSPSWKHTLSLDIPIRYKRHSTTLRLSYVADFYQSEINDIRCHIYRHAFTFGFAKTILKVKNENRIKAYSPY
jgi:hypothetical protein